MIDVKVRGAEQLEQVGRVLRHGSKDLRRDLYRGINAATKPIRTRMLAGLPAYLPSSGGLAAAVRTDTKITTKRRASGRSAGVRIQARSNRDIRALNRGRLRHPLFGNRRFWYTQRVRPGWFDGPAEAGAPVARVHLVALMNDIVQRIARASR